MCVLTFWKSLAVDGHAVRVSRGLRAAETRLVPREYPEPCAGHTHRGLLSTAGGGGAYVPHSTALAKQVRVRGRRRRKRAHSTVLGNKRKPNVTRDQQLSVRRGSCEAFSQSSAAEQRQVDVRVSGGSDTGVGPDAGAPLLPQASAPATCRHHSQRPPLAPPHCARGVRRARPGAGAVRAGPSAPQVLSRSFESTCDTPKRDTVLLFHRDSQTENTRQEAPGEPERCLVLSLHLSLPWDPRHG